MLIYIKLFSILFNLEICTTSTTATISLLFSVPACEFSQNSLQSLLAALAEGYLKRAERNVESPMDCKEIQPVHSEGDQPWDFFRRNDAKAEIPVLWPPHAKSWLIGKDSDAGRD